MVFSLLLIHKLGDPKYKVSGISGCSDMFVIIRHFRVSVRRTGTFLVYIYLNSVLFLILYISIMKIKYKTK